MNWEGCLGLPSILTIVSAFAAIFLPCFLFAKFKFLLLRKREIPPSPISPILNNTTTITTADLATVAGEYEVFLSFCGQDTRHGFTDFLYTSLDGAGISTFRDNERLRVGEQIGPELLKAINDSKISIPVFSKNYALSKWCLIELAQMVECRANEGQMIFPVFYDVDPSDVRNHRGSYEKAFRQHKRKFDENTVQQWEKALKIVGELKGLELQKETNWHQGKLVKIVVEEVLSKLKKNHRHVPQELVGIHQVDNLKGQINSDSNGVQIIGIVGMGGLGKTTIANAIYNDLCGKFDCHCFLEDVREKSKGNRFINLQNHLLSKILKRQISTFYDDNEGIDQIRGAIRGKKVFIVLDDVDDKSQIEKLAGDHNWYKAGSMIIITTRDKEVLADFCTIYEPKFLNDNESLELFCKYAFKRDSPPEGYEILTKEAVFNAGGLPLVLVTLGSLLAAEKDKRLWQERFKKLKAIPHKKVQERLRISYDALDLQQQEIFLDIACFFAGVDKTNPCYMWDDCELYPLEGINALVRRSLITVREDDNTLRMHDQLRELGRHIAYNENLNEPGNWSRLWRAEQALDALTTRQLTGKVKALCLDSRQDLELDSDIQSQCLVGRDFGQVPNLRFLRLGCADLEGDFKHRLSSLRWLQWNCQINFTPTNFHLKNLVILDLSWSRITVDWKGWSEIKIARKLKVLNLSHCYGLKRATLFSTLGSLERLVLSYCTSLEEFKPSGENLVNLRVLDLSNCSCLRDLDCSRFTALESLDVQRCEELRTLDGLEQLTSLRNVKLSFCRSLVRVSRLPNSLENLYFRKCDDM